jgi:hypothetical protein
MNPDQIPVRRDSSGKDSLAATNQNVAKISNITFCEILRIIWEFPVKSFTKTTELKGEFENSRAIEEYNLF